MKITIQELKITNFKGIANLTVPFNQNEPTIISGRNKAGKSTIADAYYWVLFGIDSNANKEFTIRPQDAKGKPIDKIECSVEALITFDQNQIKIGKTHRQKWVKKRGEEKEEFTGNENLYFWNDVPLSEKEYKARIEALISEEHFKLISNFKYFQSLKWDEKRKKLYNLSADVTNQIVFEKFPKIAYLSDALANKSEEDYRKELKANISRIKKEIESTPDVISELEKQILQVNVEELTAQKIETEKQIEARNSSRRIIQDQYAINDKKIREIQSEISAIESNGNGWKKEQAIRLNDLEVSLIANKTKMAKWNEYELKYKQIEESLQNLRNEYINENSKVFVFQESKCDKCGQSIDSDENAQREQFNLSKSKNLAEIQSKANTLKTTKENLPKPEMVNELVIQAIEKQISDIQAEPAPVFDNSEIIKLQSEIEALKKVEFTDANLQAIEKEKADLELKLHEINSKLAQHTSSEKIQHRIKELCTNESKLGKEIAKLEKTEIDLQTLINQKAKIFQDNINHLFSLAKVKMFELQVNGALNPTCIILDNGVAWNETNTANKTNIGLDIINTFQKYFDLYAPIFIDDCEGINQLIECQSQTIQLHVSNLPLNID